MVRWRYFALSVGVIAVCFGVSAGVAGALSGKTNSRGRRPVEHRSASLASHFSVIRLRGHVNLRQARDEGDATVTADTALSTGPDGELFAHLMSRMGDTSGPMARFGLEPSSAVAIAVTSTLSAAVVPGTQGTCLIAQIPNSAESARAHGGLEATCAPNAAIEARGGMQMTLNGEDGNYAWGLVPNGNPTVSVTTSDGSLTVPVVDNVYAVSSTDNLQAVSFRNAYGALTTRSLAR
jgi:hypothetical protein